MKTIIELYEASILDIEGTIEDGNNYFNSIEKEFNTMKDGMCNPLMWVSDCRGGVFEWRYGYNIPELCKFMGYKNYNYVTVTVHKSRKADEWGFAMFFQTDNRRAWDTFMTLKKWKPFTKFKNFKQFCKEEIEPIFKDIDTFKAYIEENKKMR